ncbi:methyltransferase domain-containing protein [Microbacter sp. GSS18]|nr:methyltransferase domain-containing protein [Microbacter sp. GSS18]
MTGRPGETTFAAGGGEPWGFALQGEGGGRLHLRRVAGDAVEEVWWVDALCGPADAADLSILGAAEGPLLDVGCGPGRMVRAAAAKSSAALGIDVSADAVWRARAAGTPALVRSIFERLPLEGRWRTVLLLDGNIGIGGDPDALLRRCRDLLAPDGFVVIETAGSADLDDRAVFTVHDDHGRVSAPFAWARIGWATAERCLAAAGFDRCEHSVVAERHIVRACRPRTDPTTTATTATPMATSQPTASTIT